MIPLRDSSAIIQVKIGAAPIGEIYMNSSEQVRPMRGNWEKKNVNFLKMRKYKHTSKCILKVHCSVALV